MRKILYGALVVIALNGYTALSHPQAVRAQQIHPSRPMIARQASGIRPPAFQRGIDVDAYTYRGQDVAAAATAIVAYAKMLHANSLSISFPFFMTNSQSSTVFATPATPTPAQLGLLVTDARHAGLYVSLRPLLSEFQIGGNRDRWKPVHMYRWFASYQRFLLPYARMAEARRVGMFIVGAEFAQFGSSPLWNRLDRALARVYHHRLAYANGGAAKLRRTTGGLHALKTVDAYPPMTRRLWRGWRIFDRELPRGTILTELGIGAWDGAWRAPWQKRIGTHRFDPQVQVRWFSAACEEAHATGLRGIYFWNLGLQPTFPATTRAQPAAWAHSPGAAEIARCFTEGK